MLVSMGCATFGFALHAGSRQRASGERADEVRWGSAKLKPCRQASGQRRGGGRNSRVHAVPSD